MLSIKRLLDEGVAGSRLKTEESIETLSNGLHANGAS